MLLFNFIVKLGDFGSYNFFNGIYQINGFVYRKKKTCFKRKPILGDLLVVSLYSLYRGAEGFNSIAKSYSI